MEIAGTMLQKNKQMAWPCAGCPALARRRLYWYIFYSFFLAGGAMLVTVKKFCSEVPLSESMLRKMIAKRGGDLQAFGAVMRVGARILIDKEKMLDFFALGLARRIK